MTKVKSESENEIAEFEKLCQELQVILTYCEQSNSRSKRHLMKAFDTSAKLERLKFLFMRNYDGQRQIETLKLLEKCQELISGASTIAN